MGILTPFYRRALRGMSKVIELVSSGHRILTQMSPTLKPVLSSAYQAVSYDGINRRESIERQKERGGREVCRETTATQTV